MEVNVDLWSGYLDDIARHLNGEAFPAYIDTEVRAFGGKCKALAQELSRIASRFNELKVEHRGAIAVLNKTIDEQKLEITEAEEDTRAAKKETQTVRDLKDAEIKEWRDKLTEEQELHKQDVSNLQRLMGEEKERYSQREIEFMKQLSDSQKETQEVRLQLLYAEDRIREQEREYKQMVATKDARIAELEAEFPPLYKTIAERDAEIARLRALLAEAQEALKRCDYWAEREQHMRSIDEWSRRYQKLEAHLGKSIKVEEKLTQALVGANKHGDALARELQVGSHCYRSLEKHLVDKPTVDIASSGVRPWLKYPSASHEFRQLQKVRGHFQG